MEGSSTAFLIITALLLTNAHCWTYTGQPTWHEDHSQCKHGHQQSPISINTLDLDYGLYNPAAPTVLYHNYLPQSSLNLTNKDGHTMEVAGDWGAVSFKGKTYTAKQFHFHQPAEHVFDGKRYDMELHIVHQYETQEADADDFLVMALFFNVGDLEHDFLRSIKYHKGPQQWGGQEKVDEAVNLQDLISPSMVDHEFLHYNGSLTTPGCNEGVNW